jgi:hypothetical protein
MHDICTLDNRCEKLYKNLRIYDRLFPLKKMKKKETIFLRCTSMREICSKRTAFPQIFSDILLGYTYPVTQCYKIKQIRISYGNPVWSHLRALERYKTLCGLKSTLRTGVEAKLRARGLLLHLVH